METTETRADADAALIADLATVLQRLLNLSNHPYVGQPEDSELPAWRRTQAEARAVLAKARNG